MHKAESSLFTGGKVLYELFVTSRLQKIYGEVSTRLSLPPKQNAVVRAHSTLSSCFNLVAM